MAEYFNKDFFLNVLKGNAEAIRKLETDFAEVIGDTLDIAAKTLEKLPSADVVPVVRCKDCKYYEKGKDYVAYCNCFESCMGDYPKEDDFCSCGVRRADA